MVEHLLAQIRHNAFAERGDEVKACRAGSGNRARIFQISCLEIDRNDNIRSKQQRAFDGPKFLGAQGAPIDFDLRISMTNNESGYYQLLPNSGAISASPLLAFMWQKAVKEWQTTG